MRDDEHRAPFVGEPVSRVIVRDPGATAEDFVELAAKLGLHGTDYVVGWTAWMDLSPVGVSKASGLERVCAELGLTAADVLLAVEILSPGSRRTDRVIKRAEYAATGILHYWIVDLDGPSAEVLTLVDGAYEGPTVADRIAVDGRLPLVVDLSALR